MKTFFNLSLVTLLALSQQAFAHDGSHGEITNAKAAELALHRIGKLVDLKKIDATFVSHFYAVQLETLPDGDESGAVFQAKGYLVPGADGEGSKIEVLLDAKGKALSHSVRTGSVNANVQWPGKDPLTISENAFHYVLDNGSEEAIKPFYEGLTEMTLTAVAGKAKATFKSSKTSKVLVVYLTLEGVVTNSEVQ